MQAVSNDGQYHVVMNYDICRLLYCQTGVYIWCPNLLPRHFLWNTNALSTRSGSPHNALHSPSIISSKRWVLLS